MVDSGSDRGNMKTHSKPILVALAVAVTMIVASARGDEKAVAPDQTTLQSCFLIGHSLTWDTVPTKLDGDTQWHVDCGKSLPFIVEHPQKPCVKSSTLWPKALRDKQYDIIALQVHYGSTLKQDVEAITRLIELQPNAEVVIHTGWARSAERVEEWSKTENSDRAAMAHNIAYFKALIDVLRMKFPKRTFRRTQAMDMLQQVEADIAAGAAPISNVTDLYRDKIHMNLVTGRYLMHNAMRHALNQPRSSKGFEKLEVSTKEYLDSVLDRVLEPPAP